MAGVPLSLVPQYMTDTTVEILGQDPARHRASQLQEGELHQKVLAKLHQMVQERVLIQVDASQAKRYGWTTIRPVPKADSEEIRLVVRCVRLNQYVYTKKFKLEMLRDILWMEGYYQGSMDIRHAYHHMVMDRVAQKALIIEYGGQYYMFLVLPEGLNDAPR